MGDWRELGIWGGCRGWRGRSARGMCNSITMSFIHSLTLCPVHLRHRGHPSKSLAAFALCTVVPLTNSTLCALRCKRPLLRPQLRGSKLLAWLRDLKSSSPLWPPSSPMHHMLSGYVKKQCHNSSCFPPVASKMNIVLFLCFSLSTGCHNMAALVWSPRPLSKWLAANSCQAPVVLQSSW